VATAWTLHGMKDEGSCIVRCVVLCAPCVHLRPSIAHGVLYVDSAGFAPRFTRRSADTDRRRDANPRDRDPSEKSCDRQHTHTCRPLAGELASTLCPSHVISCSLPSPTVLLASM